MSLWRHGETSGNEIEPPEKNRKNSDVGSKTVSEADKKKLTPNQEFRDRYRLPEDKLNKPESNKLSKPNESDNRPGQKGGNGLERGFEHER